MLTTSHSDRPPRIDYARPAISEGWRPMVDLAAHLGGQPEGGELTRSLVAPVLHLSPGRLDLDLGEQDGADGVGLLLLDGLLLVSLRAGRAHVGWLVGGEDLIRPADMGEIGLTRASEWTALAPTRLAVLDHGFAMRAGGIPVIERALVGRATRTTNWLLAKSLAASSPVVEERLLLLFALLGERWGTVGAEGVTLRLPLTHALLASLCCARRPTVTTALQALQAAGFVGHREDGSWLLRRDHPRERNGRFDALWGEPEPSALSAGEHLPQAPVTR